MGLRGLDPGALSRTVELIFHDAELRVVDLEDLIAMNIFAGRSQDMADARAAVTGAGDRLNLPLAKTLAQRFGRDVARTMSKLVAQNSVTK